MATLSRDIKHWHGCIYVTVFWKTDHLHKRTEIHLLPVHDRHTHALSRNTTWGWGNQHFISQADIAFVVLNVFILKITYQACICEVKILVRPWPDFPGWFPRPEGKGMAHHQFLLLLYTDVVSSYLIIYYSPGPVSAFNAVRLNSILTHNTQRYVNQMQIKIHYSHYWKPQKIYVTWFEKTDHVRIFYIKFLRNTDLKYWMYCGSLNFSVI